MSRTPHKNPVIIIAIVILALVSFLIFRPSKSIIENSSEIHSMKSTVQKSIGEVASDPIPLPPVPNSQIGTLDCQGINSWILQKPVSEIKKSLFSVLKPGEENCFSKIDSSPFDFESCKAWNTNPQDKTQSFQGSAFLSSFRRQMVLEAYRDTTHLESLELSILANMIGALFVKDRSAEENKLFFDITQNYMERMPGQVDAIKAHMTSIEPSNSPEKRKYLESLAETGLKIDPKERDLLNTRLDSYLNSPDGNEKLDQYIKENPEDGYGYYYTGIRYWNSGNKDQALRNLGRARQLDPSNEAFKKVYSKAYNSTPKENPE